MTSLHRTLLAAGALGVLAVTGLVAAPGAHDEKPAASTSKAARIARGRYLVMVSGCNDCHTPGTLFGKPNTKRLLAGSEVGWQGPWGVSYASNLTPDRKTGLGTWTEKQIVTAFTLGRDDEGKPVLPPMPWQNFAHFTNADANAIAAYLKSVPAIRHKVPEDVPPGSRARGPVIVLPTPSAWDAPPRE